MHVPGMGEEEEMWIMKEKREQGKKKENSNVI